jgi:hypothetical protein
MSPRLGAGFFYAVASVPLMIAGIVGPDVFHLSAGSKELVFFGCMAAAFVCVIAGADKEIKDESSDRNAAGRRRRMISIYGMLICGLGFIGFAAVYFWPSVESSAGQAQAKPGPLAGLTNAQLRERTLAFVQTLRGVEDEHEANESRLLDEQWSNTRHSQNAAAPVGRPYSDGLIARSNAYAKEFMQKYRSDAVIIREEIQSRLGGVLPKFPATSAVGKITEDNGTQIFEGPLLAGTHPISAGADLLEYWAKQIP